MKLIVLLATVAVAAAAPQFHNNHQQTFHQREHVPILVDERNGPDEFGNFNFRYETGDGTRHQAQGNPVGEDSFAVQGSYSFISPEGDHVVVSYIADEGGFRAESPYLPTPPPMPAHALAQVRAAEEAFARQRNNPTPNHNTNTNFNRPQNRRNRF